MKGRRRYFTIYTGVTESIINRNMFSKKAITSLERVPILAIVTGESITAYGDALVKFTLTHSEI